MRTLIVLGALLVGSWLPLFAAPPAAPDLDAYAWYLPYNELVRLDWALTDAAHAKAETAQAVVCLALTPESGSAPAEQSWPLQKKGSVQVKRALPDGRYTATVSVRGRNGTVLYTSGNPVVVRHYAFMHNRLGEERVVVPPFTKIRASGRDATVWGRTFRFGKAGLPESVDVLGRNILDKGGVRVELRSGKRTETLVADRPFTVATADGYDAAGTASGQIGGLTYTLDGRLEYDGCYFVRLTVEAGRELVTVDSLVLVIPFADPVDTYSFQKNDRDIMGQWGLSRFGGIRAGQQGVIFDARSLPSFSAYNGACENYFVPAIYVGTGSRGLWYYADSDWDWYLNPKNEHAMLERVDGHVRLRIPFVNDRVTWQGKRVFTFVLMPQPVKPLPSGWRKIAWGYPEDGYLHDTSGWRYYGDGVNAFSLPSDDDYVRLGRVIAGEDPWPKNMNGAVVKHLRDDPRPYVLYGSSLMAGAGPANGEWEALAPEWVSPAFARMPFDADVKNRFLGKRSYGGFEWKDDVSLKPCGLTWTDSWLDFALFYQEKLVRIAGVNGTWFDNQSCFTIPDFDAAGNDRHLIENPNRFPTDVPLAERPFNYGRRYHILQFREYLKRLVTMCHQTGRSPFWMVNQHPTWSFAQIAWHIEADYYANAGERDLIEHFGVESFRAHVCSQGGLIGRLHFSGPVSDQPPREGHPDAYGVRLDDATAGELPGIGRTHTGLCLVHDTGMITGRDPLLLRALDQRFGFFADDVRFLPYWEQTAVKADSDRVYVSVFANSATKQALAVLFNEKKGARGLTVPLTIAASVDGLPVNRAVDLETGEPLSDLAKGKAGCRTFVYVPPRDFRLLLLE